ncbi:MAG: surfeit locus 1 family protein [Sphingomonadales bacterium]|jgi:cytochrome oxidase assembly protein ShyY1|nr:surfeit locus 1 family protein [Sphingomonadales bacterium]
MKRPPLIPTLVVLLAAGLMIRLGIWQLHRADEKDALLARYEQNSKLPEMALPNVAVVDDRLLYRRARAFCLRVVRWRVAGGESEAGKGGTRFLAECRSGAEGPGFVADMGVSQQPRFQPSWRGGEVAGTIAAAPSEAGLWDRLARRAPPPRPMLVSFTPAPGLEPSRQPSRTNIPNNSFAYAIQWFLFAATALVIYALALRRRRRG